MGTLIVTAGPRAGERIEVVSEMVLGREDCDITILDAELSRRHARVRPVGNHLEIEDLESTNGTWVDGSRIEAVAALGNGARVQIGETILSVELPEPVADPGATRVQQAPADPGATALRPTPPPPDATTIRARPEPEPEPEPAPEPEPEPEPVAAAEPEPAVAPASLPLTASAPPAQPFGALAPPVAARRRGKVATRLYGPAAVTILIIVATAVALIIYFATR